MTRKKRGINIQLQGPEHSSDILQRPIAILPVNTVFGKAKNSIAQGSLKTTSHGCCIKFSTQRVTTHVSGRLCKRTDSSPTLGAAWHDSQSGLDPLALAQRNADVKWCERLRRGQISHGAENQQGPVTHHTAFGIGEVCVMGCGLIDAAVRQSHDDHGSDEVDNF